MSRYNPHRDPVPIYEAAQKWRDTALLKGASVFAGENEIWTLPPLDELNQYFVESRDAGQTDFLTKLKGQLSEGSPACQQLMGEILWLTLLFPSNIGAAKKRENVQTIWSWSNEDLDTTHPLLTDAVLGGIGSAGTAYNTHRWRELAFIIEALRDFKGHDNEEQKRITSDPWRFSEWLSDLPGAQQRQLIHILPHLLFPDTFERISSHNDKRRILAGFEGIPEKKIRTWSTQKVDRTLLALRDRLEAEQGRKIDFYQEDLALQWQNQSKSWLLSWNPTLWNWETLAADRAATINGEKADNRWRCSSSKPREGDRVFLIRTGTSQKGIVAAGKVTRAPYEAEHWKQARADAGETTRFIDVAFDSVRDAISDRIIPLVDLQTSEPDQVWNPQSSGIEINAKAARTIERLWKALPPIAPDATVTGDNASPEARSLKRASPPLNLILYGPARVRPIA